MKKFLVLLLWPFLLVSPSLLSAAAPASQLTASVSSGPLTAAAPCTAGCTGVALAWSYAGTPNVPPCSATVTLNCFSGFTVVITPPSGSPVTLTPATLGPTLTAYTWESGAPLLFGSYGISMTATGVGASATTALTSPAVTATAVYALTQLNPVTGVTGTPAP